MAKSPKHRNDLDDTLISAPHSLILEDHMSLKGIISGDEDGKPLHCFNLSYEHILRQNDASEYRMLMGFVFVFILFALSIVCSKTFDELVKTYQMAIGVTFLAIVFCSLLYIQHAYRNTNVLKSYVKFNVYTNGVVIFSHGSRYFPTKIFTWKQINSDKSQIRFEPTGGVTYCADFYTLTIDCEKIGSTDIHDVTLIMDALTEGTDKYNQKQAAIDTKNT